MNAARRRTGPADLLRLLAAREDVPPASLCLDESEAHWFGYAPRGPQVELPVPPKRRKQGKPLPVPTVQGGVRLPLRMPALFMVTEDERLAPNEAQPDPLPAVRALELDDERLRPAAARCQVRNADLCPRARVLPALKRWLGATRPGALDLPTLVDRLARQRQADPLPRLRNRAWQPDLLMLMDWGETLWPYRHDMLSLARWVRQDAGEHRVVQRCLQSGPWHEWRPLGRAERPLQGWPAPQPHRWPQAGGKVLIVSDLGLTGGKQDTPLALAWQSLLRALVQAGLEVLVLAPLAVQCMPRARITKVKIIRWSADAPLRPNITLSAEADGAEADSPELLNLLAMVAATRRTDPALVRAFRALLPTGQGDASLEARVWSHADVAAGGACWIRPGRALPHLQRFHALPLETQAQVHALSDAHHLHLPPVLLHEEALLRHHWAGDGLKPQLAGVADEATAFFRAMLPRLHEPGHEHWDEVARELLARLEADSPANVPPVLLELAQAVYADDAVAAVPAWLPPPEGIDRDEAIPRVLVHDRTSGHLLLTADRPGERQLPLCEPFSAHVLYVRQGSARSQLRLRLQRNQRVIDFGPVHDLHAMEWRMPDRVIRADWVARPRGAAGWSASAEGIVSTVELPEFAFRCKGGRPVAAPQLHAAERPWIWLPAPSPWPEGAGLHKSRLGVAWWTPGFDEFGAFADLRLAPATRAASSEGNVLQRLRWIEPGSFMMGSPEDEALRTDDEGPQHEVTLTRGYWLADTPCTQGLWKAVMGGKNPSRLSKGSDAMDRPVDSVSWNDVQGFLKRLQGLLPAGSEVVLPTEAQWEYAARAGTRTAYAWGDEPDVKRANMEGSVGETSVVKRYEANAWGLYDMHGNVWEWCADGPRTYRNQAEENPHGGTGGDLRVLRGGSWDYSAHWARSAYRLLAHLGRTWDVLGFRLALRSPSPVPGGPGEWAGRRPAPAAGSSPRPAEPGAASNPAGSRPGRKGKA